MYQLIEMGGGAREQVIYKDIKIDANTFVRQLNSVEYRYTNNELVLSTKKVRTQFMDTIEKSKEESFSNKILIKFNSINYLEFLLEFIFSTLPIISKKLIHLLLLLFF